MMQEMKPITASDIEKGFEPIPDLKPGDKVRAKSEKLNTAEPTRDGVIITVHRIGDFSINERGRAVDRNDFTALFERNSDEAVIVELAFDSRRFERVE